MPQPSWPAIIDADYVERLIPAIQRAIAEVTSELEPDWFGLGDTDFVNALMMILATILEPSPASSTPAGMRKLSEAAGRELHQLMRETRMLNGAALVAGSTVN